MLLPETFLHRVQFAVRRQTFNGCNVGAVGLHGKHRAGLHGLAIEHYGARAADRSFTADVCAG